MNSSTYRSILRVLESWPLDPSKTGRDFGEFLRRQVANNFKANSSVKEEVWEEITNRLNRLASDHHKKSFSCSQISSSTGLTEQECNQVLSNESIQYLNEEDERTAGSSVKRFVARLPFGKS